EQAQLVQPPDPPHGPGVRSRQLGDPYPETAKVASLIDQLVYLHVIRRVTADGQQDQTQLALRLRFSLIIRWRPPRHLTRPGMSFTAIWRESVSLPNLRHRAAHAYRDRIVPAFGSAPAGPSG